MPISPIVSASTTPEFDGEGSFSAGTTAVFFFSFTDILGRAYDPSDFEVEILDPSDASANTGTALDKLELGRFAYTWAIPATADTGTYTFNLTYTVETVDGPSTDVFSQEFIVSEVGQGSITLRQVSSRAFLESLIREAMAIPVFDEPLRWLDNTRTKGELTFPLWNQSAGAKIFRNQDLIDTGYTIDYLRGRVDFSVPVSSYTEITASYNFRWFTDEELDAYIEQGISAYNIWPPATTETINNIQDRWLIVGIYGAAINAIRRLLFGLIYQQPVKVYGTMERAEKVFQQLEALKKNYLEERDKLLEQKKFGPYAGLTMTTTTPEFTLPGGRCLKGSSEITYVITDSYVNENYENVYTNEGMYIQNEFDDDIVAKKCIYKTDTIKKIYGLFEQGLSIEVLSDNNGILEFAPVSKIWESGRKPLIKIKDNHNNFVEVSEEHIMFVNGSEMPARDVQVGDYLTINHNDKIIQSVVTKVSEVKEELTFDIEVPSTENLFVNNIKCHNSRWFRYLFKGGVVFFPLTLWISEAIRMLSNILV